MMAWLAAHERWLPGVAGLAWWTIFHPGFIGDDSLIHLTDARDGVVGVWFTAWWIYVVDTLTLGTRAVSLLTLVSVLTIEYAVYLWIVTVFPAGRARALTLALMVAAPLVPGLGIQVRHDVPMTAGLLLCAVALARWWPARRFTGADYALLAAAAPLVATRHNGAPTLVAAALLLLIVTRGREWRRPLALVAVAAASAVITYGATKASGNTHSVDPFQAVEWVIGDIACALSRGVSPNAAEWATLERIAAAAEWPQWRACVAINPLHTARSFRPPRTTADARALVDAWASLVAREPSAMIAAHASRVRLFLPPFAAGMPTSFRVNFMHSTIVPNEFGLAWTFPTMAETARHAVRLWNALAFAIANAAVWLIALLFVGWKSPAQRASLTPTIVMATALLIGLLVAAPVSEGRYAFFILICGQSATLFVVLRTLQRP